MGKFGIGARVKDDDGDVGVIVAKPEKGERTVQYEGNVGNRAWLNGEKITWSKKDITLIPDNDNAAEWVPKVGDRVVMSKDSPWYCGKTKTTGTLVEPNEGAYTPYAAVFDGDDFKWHLQISDIQPLPVAEQPAAEVKAEVTDNRSDAGGGFKAGDRIRLIDGALDNMPLGSEFVAVARTGGLDTSVHFKVENDEYTTWRPGSYFELVAPLKIEAGKSYRTRDGRKVGPATAWDGDSDFYPLCRFVVDGVLYQPNGVFADGASPKLDLVAEWVEPATAEVAVAEATATLKDIDDALPGDVYLCVKWQGEMYTSGKEYKFDEDGFVSDECGVKRSAIYAGEWTFLRNEPAAPPAKFKVGDRVRVVGSRNAFGKTVTAIPLGTEVILGDQCEMAEGGREGWQSFEVVGWNYWVRTDDLELLPAIPLRSTVTFTATGRLSAVNDNGHYQVTFPDLPAGRNSFALPAAYVSAAK